MPIPSHDDELAAGVAAHAAKIAEAAGTSNSPNKKYRRGIDEAAAIVAERSQRPFSARACATPTCRASMLAACPCSPTRTCTPSPTSASIAATVHYGRDDGRTCKRRVEAHL